ncbi:bidirectional hydrogenase complex protein HoxE [Desulfomonile tiedjei]|uniref:NADH:ubiquinone oxidoreductase 24 kD subunit n=1 Tax=Desulfomonile tiedjei (strain ATCC 49306 / DSM 6799 / DCB-1) TaxID=706587 RepID=I4C0J2_DESTA|nr:bidirectional hydrogenase complex protein HoxE [Desulfomonile tiedjei]AFM23083.1 NADH:ubiquinone oxidoreductase 24 kD subunit [Desulfomonile tiedjei DSM 6799]
MEAKQGAKTKEAQDSRWRFVNRTMRVHGHAPHALIETLHAVQEHFGFLDLEALKYVAGALHVPLSQVYGVATFYHYFTMKPPGEHTCVVCKGTACYIGGAAAILNSIGDEYGIAPGETTPDGKISLVTARCLGSCGLAPAVVFDGEVKGRMASHEVLDRIRRWTNHDTDV